MAMMKGRSAGRCAETSKGVRGGAMRQRGGHLRPHSLPASQHPPAGQGSAQESGLGVEGLTGPVRKGFCAAPQPSAPPIKPLLLHPSRCCTVLRRLLHTKDPSCMPEGGLAQHTGRRTGRACLCARTGSQEHSPSMHRSRAGTTHPDPHKRDRKHGKSQHRRKQVSQLTARHGAYRLPTPRPGAHKSIM